MGSKAGRVRAIVRAKVWSFIASVLVRRVSTGFYWEAEKGKGGGRGGGSRGVLRGGGWGEGLAIGAGKGEREKE